MSADKSSSGVVPSVATDATPTLDAERCAKMAELQKDLDRFAPGLTDGTRYARLHTWASSVATSLAFRYGELAALRADLAAARSLLREAPDTKRLEFLRDHISNDDISEVCGEWRVGFYHDAEWQEAIAATFRDAVDEAMRCVALGIYSDSADAQEFDPAAPAAPTPANRGDANG